MFSMVISSVSCSLCMNRPIQRDKQRRFHVNFLNTCQVEKLVFPNVLSKFGFHSMLDTSTFDFIQPQFSVNQNFQKIVYMNTLFEVHKNFICNPTQTND